MIVVSVLIIEDDGHEGGSAGAANDDRLTRSATSSGKDL
jgi:hypothetical protein